MKESDIDQDNKISFEEFKTVLLPHTHTHTCYFLHAHLLYCAGS